jgi:hypothetical protein
MNKVLALQFGDKLVDICRHDGDLCPGFRCNGFRDFVNLMTLEKAFPDNCTDWIQAEQLIFADVENDCAIVVSD